MFGKNWKGGGILKLEILKNGGGGWGFAVA